MKFGGTAKHILMAIILASVGYFAIYHFIEGRRTQRGPWDVRFLQSPGQDPRLVINQPNLAITNVEVVFPLPGTPIDTNLNVQIVFDRPREVPFPVPFGECALMDLRFLPGTVTLRLFGHELELLPRALMVNRQEHPWQKDMVLMLHPFDPGSTNSVR
jgi:hypothetical protein